MILATTLVFLFGGFLGWLYGKRSGRNELIELRRQKQIGRVGTREQKRYSYSLELPAIDASNSSTSSTASKHSSVSSSSIKGSSHNISDNTNAPARSDDKCYAGADEQDFDELYKIAGRVKPLEFELRHSWQRVAELEKKTNRKNTFYSAEVSDLPAPSPQTTSSAFSDSPTSNNALVSTEQDAGDLDELYRISARVKPLEYDLTQRKIEVRALKQSLQDVRRINDKQLVSVRLQAENQSRLLYKEKLIEKQNQIESLQTKLSDLSKSQSQKLQAQVEQSQLLGRERDQLKSQSESQLESIRVLTEQSSTLQSKTNTLQNKLAKLKQERININGSFDHFNTQISKREKQLDELREKQFLLDQKNQDIESINVQQSQELASTKKQLVGTLENLTQSEKRVAELQNEVSGLNQKLTSCSTELDAVQLSLVAQQERLNLIPELEATVLNSQQELVLVQKRAEQVDSLQATIADKDEHIVSLRRQSDRVVSLESAVKKSEAQIRKLNDKNLQVVELEKQLIEKDRKIISLQRFESKASDQAELISNLKREYDNAITDKKILENSQIQLRQELAIAKESVIEVNRVRTELVKSRKAEAQLAQAHDELIKARQMKADLDRLQSRLQTSAADLEQNRVVIENLSQLLKKAELAAMTAKQNDIEVRRLRSELQSLQSIHDKSVSKVQSLERQIRQQDHQIVTNKQLKERVRELESVKTDIVHRDQQIADLNLRLIELKNERTQNANSSKKQFKKRKSSVPLTPLFATPAEKDDLKKINGIGPVMEKMLNSLGVTSFKQVAEFKPDDITTVTEAIQAFPGRIERDNWVGGAKEQYARKYRKADA